VLPVTTIVLLLSLFPWVIQQQLGFRIIPSDVASTKESKPRTTTFAVTGNNVVNFAYVNNTQGWSFTAIVTVPSFFTIKTLAE
jgi:hypothetical protein